MIAESNAIKTTTTTTTLIYALKNELAILLTFFSRLLLSLLFRCYAELFVHRGNILQRIHSLNASSLYTCTIVYHFSHSHTHTDALTDT